MGTQQSEPTPGRLLHLLELRSRTQKRAMRGASGLELAELRGAADNTEDIIGWLKANGVKPDARK